MINMLLLPIKRDTNIDEITVSTFHIASKIVEITTASS